MYLGVFSGPKSQFLKVIVHIITKRLMFVKILIYYRDLVMVYNFTQIVPQRFSFLCYKYVRHRVFRIVGSISAIISMTVISCIKFNLYFGIQKIQGANAESCPQRKLGVGHFWKPWLLYLVLVCCSAAVTLFLARSTWRYVRNQDYYKGTSRQSSRRSRRRSDSSSYSTSGDSNSLSDSVRGSGYYRQQGREKMADYQLEKGDPPF